MENFFNKDLAESYDVIILGGGPAGCSAGMYAARDALSVLILEKNFPGGNMAITEHIENYPGFTEPVLGHEITDKFVKHAQKFGAILRQGNCVEVIDEGVWKTVILEDGRKIKCKALIIATGSKPKKTEAKNEQNFIGRGISFCATCDGGFFRNKEVIVIGGGDSALEEGIYLTKFASKVTIVHRRNEFRAAKIIQQRAKENEKIHFMTPYVVNEVVGENTVTGVKLENRETGEIVDYKCDGIFEFIGWDANTDIFTEPTMKGKLGTNVVKTKKHLYDHVLYDSANEKNFAQELDTNKDVAVYVKLPNGFYISTPVGKYNPDWAIAFYEGTVKHIFFVAETKGTMESLNLRPIEQAKISCAKKLFNEMSTSNVKYHDVDSYQSLLNIMNSI